MAAKRGDGPLMLEIIARYRSYRASTLKGNDPMGRYGTDSEDDDIDWPALRPLRSKPRLRLTPQRTAHGKKLDMVTRLVLKPDINRSATDIKTRIKDAVLDNPHITTRELMKMIDGVSAVTMSHIRSEFRHSLKLLRERGLLA